MNAGGGGGFLARTSAAADVCPNGTVPPWIRTHQVKLTKSGVFTVEYCSLDVDGNAGPTGSTTVMIARVAPVSTASLSPAPSANGWYAAPTLTLGASDPVSGVATIQYSLDSGPWTTYAGPVSGFSNGHHALRYRATDVAGNVEAAHTLGFRVDSVGPTVTIVRPADGASYPLGSVKTASYNCADTKSGMASCVGAVANGSAFDTSTVGDHSFTVTGRDRVGNTTVKTVHYQVVYTWNGFFSPVTNEDTSKLNLAHAGDLVRLGFGLDGDRGLSVLAGGVPTSAPVACPSWTPHLVPAAGDGATEGLSYGTASGHYSYGWQTDAAWAGTCRQFRLTLNDGTPAHTAVFMLFP
jgi:hypothetical protein